ncbi:MAG: DDE-type integrase/transposase/recombinase [Desulfosoma sp.]|uniref:DDE-type integrase/transposase/recombinase n=1 Tax=Desulfosoma sp. TaxID=2603217 RepID=UPI00404B8BEE
MDITKLSGPAKSTDFNLYVILDIFSRYVVGWVVVHRESAALAEHLIRETIAKQRIMAGQLTIHADRRSSMKSKCVAQLPADMGVRKSHSRPYVSNDNFSLKRSSKRSSTVRNFPGGVDPFKMPDLFLRGFLNWYNKLTATAASVW